jgi:hypothetical protein
MPAMMQSATQSVSQRSNSPIRAQSPDILDPACGLRPAQLAMAKGEEELDAAFEHAEGVAKGDHALGFRAVGGRRIGHAPMRGDRMPRPDRADLAGGVVADGEDIIHVRRVRRGELRPAFRSQPVDRQLHLLQQRDRERIDRAFRVGTGAPRLEATLPPVIEDRFGKDAARRIAGAQEEHVADRRCRLIVRSRRRRGRPHHAVRRLARAALLAAAAGRAGAQAGPQTAAPPQQFSVR